MNIFFEFECMILLRCLEESAKQSIESPIRYSFEIGIQVLLFIPRIITQILNYFIYVFYLISIYVYMNEYLVQWRSTPVVVSLGQENAAFSTYWVLVD